MEEIFSLGLEVVNQSDDIVEGAVVVRWNAEEHSFLQDKAIFNSLQEKINDNLQGIANAIGEAFTRYEIKKEAKNNPKKIEEQLDLIRKNLKDKYGSKGVPNGILDILDGIAKQQADQLVKDLAEGKTAKESQKETDIKLDILKLLLNDIL